MLALMGESGESAVSQGRLRLVGGSGANRGRLGSQPREVMTSLVVLRAGFLSAKTHEGYLVGVSESDWLELVSGCHFC